MKRFIIAYSLIVMAFMPLFADDDSFFSDDSDFSDESSSTLVLGGELSSSCAVDATADGFAAVFDADDLTDELSESTELELTGSYAGTSTDLQFSLDVTTDGVDIDEAYVRYYGDLATVTAGYDKVVWGTADEYHVVDVLNSLDYSDFIQSDYLSMVISRPMVKFDIPVFDNCLLEAAWMPVFEGNTYDYDGDWTPYQLEAAYSEIEEALTYQSVALYSETYEETYTEYLETVYEVAYATAIDGGYSDAVATSAATTAMSDSENTTSADVTANAAASLAQTEYLYENADGEVFYEDMGTFDNSQFGLHFSGSAGPFDFGLIYYFGYYKDPSMTTTVSGDYITDCSISYDSLQTFGAEAAAILAGFNLKAEFAYNMTSDYTGDDADVHNNNIQWVGGFDRDIPLSNLNINIQETGSYIINYDQITSSSDVEASENEIENILIVSLSDNYCHQKIDARVTGMYHFEDADWMIMPSVSMDLDDNWEVSMTGRFLEGDDQTLFGQYDDNDEIEIAASYSF